METPRHLGKIVNDTIYIKGNDSFDDGEDWFSYKLEDKYYRGKQQKQSIRTTVTTHREGMCYPLTVTGEIVRIKQIDGDYACVEVVHTGTENAQKVQNVRKHLNELQLVKDYTYEFTNAGRTTQSSKMPVIVSKCQKEAAGRVTRRKQMPAIVIGPIHRVSKALEGLSAKVNMVITHDATNNLDLRVFEKLDDIKRLFKSQGSMDKGGQGRSCGVEAIYNAGFVNVTAESFDKYQQVDVGDFIGDPNSTDHDAHDDYVNNKGGGNDIPPNQMFWVIKDMTSLTMQNNFHNSINELNRHEFWTGRKFAILNIPVCGGHWLSIEKITYAGQETFCLREGRGNMAYDFVNYPDTGNMQPLNSKRMRSVQ